MSIPDHLPPSAQALHALFPSYASQDVAAARFIAAALGAADLGVWLEQGELGGGDQWDATIRLQIA